MSWELQDHRTYPIAALEDGFEPLKSLNPHLAHSALPALIQYAASIGAEWTVIEDTYIDRDFNNEHGSLYTHAFRNVPNRCIRVHFFSCPPTTIRSQSSGYLGYTVLRPLPVNAVGRTVLAPPSEVLAGATPLVLTASEHIPHLLGVPLPIKGTPFCQQDGMMMRCAQAALWTATRIMYKRYRTSLFFPGHINVAAARHSSAAGRVFPLDAGLEMAAMVAALNELGFQPHFVGSSRVQIDPSGQFMTPAPLEVDRMLRSAIPFLLSAIPVILGIPEHVVTAVGFLMERQPLRSSCAWPGLSFFEDWVAGLIVHDDALAPYRVMPTPEWLNSLTGRKRKEVRRWLRDAEAPADKDILSIDSVLIPGTNDFWLRLRDARNHAAKLHLVQERFWSSLVFKTQGQYPQSLLDLTERFGSKLVLRWRLMNSKILKKQVLPAGTPLSGLIGRVHMPRFVWLGELLWASDMASHPSKWKVCGEIVVDSMANQFHPCVLAIHLPGGQEWPGVLYVRDPDTGWDNYDEKGSGASLGQRPLAARSCGSPPSRSLIIFFCFSPSSPQGGGRGGEAPTASPPAFRAPRAAARRPRPLAGGRRRPPSRRSG